MNLSDHLVFAIIVLALVLSLGAVAVYDLSNQVSTLRAENAQLRTRACERGRDDNPVVPLHERKVIG